MNIVTGFLDALEKLTYRILMWVILFPKTLLKIILDPKWVPGYIKGQLLPIQKHPFNEYVSPVTFFVVISLAPLLFLSYLPTYEAKLATKLIDEDFRYVQFDVEAYFKPHSGNLWHETRWGVWSLGESIMPNDDEFIHGESHYTSGELPLVYQNEKYVVVGNPNDLDSFGSMHIVDNNLVIDSFYYAFDGATPGAYSVDFSGAYFANGSDIPIERETAHLLVIVPEDPQAPLEIRGSSISTDEDSNNNTSRRKTWEELQGMLQSGDTYQLALSLLALPLAFAVIGRGLRKQSIGEEELKAGFHTQCYLLSPVSAAYWATTYANKFATPDIFFKDPSLYQYQDYVIWLPFALMLLWLFFVEIGLIAQERGVGNFRAFLVLFRYVFTLFMLFVFVQTGQYFRKSAIAGYVLLVLALVLISGFRSLKRVLSEARSKRKQ